MGIQDRDWYREESKRRLAREIRGRWPDVVDVDPSASVRRTARTGAFWIALFWLALLGVTYGGFKYVESTRAARFKAYPVSSSEMVIPRSADGHFRVQGEINGQTVQFLVDTGASSVAVTDAFAQRAGLRGGQPTTFMTANGPRPGRMLRDVPVLAGNMAAARVDVGTGLFAQTADEALLGQSFLSQFDVILRKDHMVIKQRGR